MIVPSQGLDLQCYMSWSFLCSMVWGKGWLLFCWYLWNCWQSLFKLSFHNETLFFSQFYIYSINTLLNNVWSMETDNTFFLSYKNKVYFFYIILYLYSHYFKYLTFQIITKVSPICIAHLSSVKFSVLLTRLSWSSEDNLTFDFERK